MHGTYSVKLNTMRRFVLNGEKHGFVIFFFKVLYLKNGDRGAAFESFGTKPEVPGRNFMPPFL